MLWKEIASWNLQGLYDWIMSNDDDDDDDDEDAFFDQDKGDENA